jgi:helix-turn-helix protein
MTIQVMWTMGRREKPIDPAWPLAEFASGLRELRRGCGLTYQEMADRTNYSACVLSVAAGGVRLPTWDVALAYVRVCGGSEQLWCRRWERARQVVVEYRNGVGHG